MATFNEELYLSSQDIVVEHLTRYILNNEFEGYYREYGSMEKMPSKVIERLIKITDFLEEKNKLEAPEEEQKVFEENLQDQFLAIEGVIFKEDVIGNILSIRKKAGYEDKASGGEEGKRQKIYLTKGCIIQR